MESGVFWPYLTINKQIKSGNAPKSDTCRAGPLKIQNERASLTHFLALLDFRLKHSSKSAKKRQI